MYTSKFSELQVGKYKEISLYILVKMLKAKDKGREGNECAHTHT